ncbi:autotransporter outer membrane beta-barrel domain-containing protein [Pelagibacterium limicola]|uniref:autotransporter outer membrane beta-barrel domain-containing protein n=1 Tax=Pelagibacterium limicola TaxID=2791022 RepID=UPI0018B0038C|nr:autotransporter domain-containing protein [Pelagibacterium limicola]
MTLPPPNNTFHASIDWDPNSFTGFTPILTTVGGFQIDNLLFAFDNGHIGTLAIEGGGSLGIDGDLLIGLGQGSFGSLAVSDTDGNGNRSAFTAVGGFSIGSGLNSNGALIITDGAIASALLASSIGQWNGSNGSVTVIGADGALRSQFIIQDDLDVGVFGAGLLDITDGGEAAVLGTLTFGTNGSGIGGATVSGADANGTNSKLLVGGDIYVGAQGTGSLSMENGGFADASNGAVYIGYDIGSGGILNVTGAGSALLTDNLRVGGAGSGALTVAEGGQVVVTDSIQLNHWGGQGSVIVTGAGSTLTAMNSLFIGENTVAGSTGELTVSDGGQVSAGTISIGGTGGIGRLNIGGAVTAAAAGTVDTGSIVLGNGGTGMLIFNHTDTSGNYIFAPDLTGNGSIVHQAGTTIFTGNSATFAGNTALAADSKLVVNGSLGGSLGVGGILGGNGMLDQVHLFSGGVIAPGNSIGTLTVATITFDPGSIYLVELNDGGNTPGVNNDFIDVTGSATISGGTVHVTPENGTDNGTSYTLGTTYTILSAAGGIMGPGFSAVTDDYAFLNFVLSNDANNVYLTSAPGATSFCLAGMTANQCATGDGVFSLGSGGLHTAVLNLSNAAAPAALDLLSGEIHVSAKTVLVEDSRFVREAAVNRLRTAFGAAGANGNGMAGRDVSDTLTFWGQGLASRGHWDSDGNAAQVARSIGGVLLGGDAALTDTVRLGLMGGYSVSRLGVDDRSSSASVESWTVGAYSGGQWDIAGGAFALRGGAAYGGHSIDVSRSVAFAGFSDALSANYGARTLQAFGEAAYGLDAGQARFEPFASLAHVNLSTDEFTETGGAAALSATGQTIEATFATLGIRAETTLNLGEAATARLHGSAGWRHAFGDTPDAMLSFASGSDTFTITGVPIARDALVLNAGLDLDITSNARLGLSYGGQFGQGAADHTFKANFNVSF